MSFSDRASNVIAGCIISIVGAIMISGGVTASADVIRRSEQATRKAEEAIAECDRYIEIAHREIVKAEEPETAPETITEEPPELPKRHIYSDAFDTMDSEEYEVLARILALEADGEPFEGQVAVVEVVMNRVISDDPYFPDTIMGVLSQKGQFETWKYLDDPYAVPSDITYEAINYVMENGLTVLPKVIGEAGYTHPEDYVFFATYKANGSNFVKIKHHYFSK